MALTDIARQLKDTFEGFGGSELSEEVKRFRALYGDAESIRIGEMDYIVINDEYKSEAEYGDVPESTSPLFFNSINIKYAIIDAKTSSTLIDEVYSRVTYMQRSYELTVSPEKEEMRKSLSGIVGEGDKISDVYIKDDSEAENKANIFQCHLIKDTGVSASPDVYSFMLKNGEIKAIPDSVMKQIKRTGEVTLLKDRDQIEAKKSEIQQAVFNEYFNSDIDIQSISVKSIFEISLTYLNICLLLADAEGQSGIFNTTYLASEHNEFAPLNANIHICNSCGHDLIDVRDPNKIYRLHINTDAYDPGFSKEGKIVYATGCEDCLTQCPDCGRWHFDYEKFVSNPKAYERAHLVEGRGFIRGLKTIEANYCSCREGIEWVYDEKSGSDEEHDIIPIEKLAFLNYANEKVASYEEYRDFYEKEYKRKKQSMPEGEFAKRTLVKFKKLLADRFETDIRDIIISHVDRCRRCSVCGGDYYRSGAGMDYSYDFRCDVCDEMMTERRRTVTRIDGVVFMHRRVGKKDIISKYILTKFGNLKKLSTAVTNFQESTEEAEGAEYETEEEQE